MIKFITNNLNKFCSIFASTSITDKAYYKLILLISVFFTPITFLFFFQDAFFTGIGYVDPFGYIGYGYSYIDSSYLSSYYKISRLPWILVQFLFRNLFNDDLSSYILHFTIYSSASYFIFKIADKNFGTISAFFSATITPILLYFYSGSPDYHNNFAAVLFLALIFYVINAVSKSKDDSKFFILLGGIYSLIVHTNLLSSLDVIIYVLCFYVALKINQKKPIFNLIVKKTLLTISGFLIFTLILCLVNYFVGRDFFFMKVLWEFTINFSQIDHNGWLPLDKFIRSSVNLSNLFAMFLFSLFMAGYLMVKKNHLKNPITFFANLAFIFVSLELLITHNLKANNIHLSYISFNYLVPFLLTLSVNLGFVFDNENTNYNKRKILLIALILISSILLTNIFIIPNIYINHNFLENSFIYLSILWIIALYIMFFFRQRLAHNIKFKSLIIVFILYFIFFLANFMPQISRENNKITYVVGSYLCNPAKSITKSFIELGNHLKKYKTDFTGNGNVFIWYNKNQHVKYNNCYKGYNHSYPAMYAGINFGSSGNSAYPIDDVWKEGGINEIDNLWIEDGDNWFKTYFLTKNKHPRVLALLTYDKNDVTKMINKMKSHGINFTLSENRKIMTDAFMLQYYILVENKQ